MPIRKNTKRIDPRYFLNEKAEVSKESLVDRIIQIIKNSPFDLDNTDLDYEIKNDYEIKKKFPQLSDDQIYAAMNDPKLNPYYNSLDGVYSKNSVTEEQDDSTDVPVRGGGVRSVKGVKRGIMENLKDAMQAAQQGDFEAVATRVANLEAFVQALKKVGEIK